MRKIVLMLLLVTAGCYSYAQNSLEAKKKKDKVYITNWGRKLFGLLPGFWEGVWVNDIQKQVGELEFQKIKELTLKGRIPAPPEMSVLINNGTGIADTAVLYKNLSRLNMYRIASFTQINTKGTRFEMAILTVPYEENKDWDKNVKWDSLYFFIQNKYVKFVE